MKIGDYISKENFVMNNFNILSAELQTDEINMKIGKFYDNIRDFKIVVLGQTKFSLNEISYTVKPETRFRNNDLKNSISITVWGKESERLKKLEEQQKFEQEQQEEKEEEKV